MHSPWLTLFVALALSPAAWASPHADLAPLTTVGTTAKYRVTTVEPGNSPLVAEEEWKVAEVKGFGPGHLVTIVITDLDSSGEPAGDRQVEYVVHGTKFYDVSRLERGSRAPDLSPEAIPTWLPLFDVAKLSKPEVTRYPDNPLAYVRHEVQPEFKLDSGTAYKGVVHATRNRGDTETTDEWWYSPKDGVLRIQLQLPSIAGGAKITWERLGGAPAAEPAPKKAKEKSKKKP
jgi:hypothetical protein